MPVPSALLDVLIVLLAAKLAAEGAERIKLPAVVGEILAGLVVGPSLLGWVEGGEVLAVLAEIGVILLLFEVGLETDLSELGKVGRAATAVAVVGVVVPMASGIGVGLGLGMRGNEALLVGAALTATSVGITARVFGDLRALASVEARTVLAAAVADDVFGLLILTVVLRVVDAGTISVGEIGSVLAIAVGFLVVAVVIGLRVAPPLFAAVARHGRSAGTLVALALAFTLAVSELASLAKLAPIIGAFVAGLTLARAGTAGRIRRELTPVGHLFVPVFFFQIGVEADIGAFGRPAVLGLAAALLVVAVIGKVVAAAAMGQAPGDRLLVGLGMIPRGEVGLIFATIGRQRGALSEDVFAALLLVVLVTTLVTPPLLRWRLHRTSQPDDRPGSAADVASDGERPPGGWLADAGDTVELVAAPRRQEALAVALSAAVQAESHPPGERLLGWLTSWPDEPVPWDADARDRFMDLLHHGGPRSWRLLHITGVLGHALPELDAAVTRRAGDPFDLDPVGHLRFPRLARVTALAPTMGAAVDGWPERLALAAVVVDAGEDDGLDLGGLARAVGDRIGVAAPTTSAVEALVRDVDLLAGVARRIDGFEEPAVLQLAAHLGTVDRVRALHALTGAGEGLDGREEAAVEALVGLVVAVIERGATSGPDTIDEVTRRRRQAAGLVEGSAARRIETAPRGYLVERSAVDAAREAAFCEPPPGRDEVRMRVRPAAAAGEWWLEVVTHDRRGLLACEARLVADAGLDVVEATVATWPDGVALDVLRVRGFTEPDPDRLAAALERSLDGPLHTDAAPDLEVTFDDEASPWHTVCLVRAQDRYGLLATVAAAFAVAGASVHSAGGASVDGRAVARFELTGPGGRKVPDPVKQAVRDALVTGVSGRRSRLRRGWALATR